MKNLKVRSVLSQIKSWIFEYTVVIDMAYSNNQLLALLVTLLELTVLHYYYFNQNYSSLHRYPLYKNYFQNFNKYFFHTTPFSNILFSLLILTFYPFTILIVIIVKKIGQIKILVVVIQTAIFLFPLLFVKIMIETIVVAKSGFFAFIGIPLSLLTIAFGTIILILSNRLHRYLEIPLIILL